MAAAPEQACGATPVTSHADLVACGEAAARAKAGRQWGQGDYDVRGDTQRGCCVHLIVRRGGELLARWRYELDGRIVDDHAARRGPGSSWEGASPALTEQDERGGRP